MGSVGESAPDDLTNYRCYIPTSGKKKAIVPPWQYQPICLFSPEDDLGTTKTLLYVEETVLASWAILLKSYTGSEVTSFARLHYVSLCEATNKVSCSDVGSARIDSHLVFYRIDSGAVLQHVREHQSQSYDRADQEDWPVNTAVFLSRNHRAFSLDNDERALPGTKVRSEIQDCVGNVLYFLSIVFGSEPFLHIIRRR